MGLVPLTSKPWWAIQAHLLQLVLCCQAHPPWPPSIHRYLVSHSKSQPSLTAQLGGYGG